MRIRSISVLLGITALFVFPRLIHAETNKTVGSYDTAGTAQDVIVVGTYAYVADGANGVVTLNVTTTTPTLSSTIIGSAAGANRIDASGNYLYVAAGSNGVRILNLTNPAIPAESGFYAPVGFSATDVASDGTYVYVLGTIGGANTIQVLDVTTPGSPVLASGASSRTVTAGNDLVLAANYAYIVGGQTLQVVNAYPILTIAGTYTDASATASYQGVQVYGSIAYINDSVLGMHAVTIANPASMISTYESAVQFPATGYGMGLAISNGFAFLTRSTSGGLVIFDVASTSTPSYVDVYAGSAGANGVTVANDIAYIAAGTAGIQLLDVSHPDVVPPVVTPVGDVNPVIVPGGKYTDPGVTTDPGTTKVVTGKVDTTIVGKYTLTYTVTDRAGNTTVVKRTVIVGPSVEKLIMNKNNSYTLKVGKNKLTLRPFAGYTGTIVGRRMIVATKANPLYVFISTSPLSKPAVVMYNASGKLMTRYLLTSISTKGLQLDIVPNPATLSVFIAIAPKSNGLTSTILNISKGGLKSLKTVTANKGAGTLVMKWLKGYTNEYILATLVKGKTATPYIWRYNGSKKSFVRDTKFDTTKLLWTGTSIKLK